MGLSTVADFEGARRLVSNEAIAGIQRTLVTAGIIFVENDGGAPGVRLQEGK
jgi:hypothetical protein